MSLKSPTVRLCLILILLMGVSGRTAFGMAFHGPHHPQKMAKQQVEDLEQQWRTATLTGDTSMMDSLLSEDYVGISWNGQVNTKATQLDRIRSRTLAITKLELIDSKVKVVGNVAIVTSLAQVEGTNEGTPMTGMFRYTRVYQKLASGAWKITNFEATRVPDTATGMRRPHAPQG